MNSIEVREKIQRIIKAYLFEKSGYMSIDDIGPVTEANSEDKYYTDWINFNNAAEYVEEILIEELYNIREQII